MRTRTRLASAALTVLAVLLPLAAPALLPVLAPTAAAQAADTSARTVTKETVDGRGTERTVRLTVDQTTGLQNRERVTVSWSGAQPTPNPAAGFGGAEYPVVLMQCRNTTGSADVDRRSCQMPAGTRNSANQGGERYDGLTPAVDDPAAGDLPFTAAPASAPCVGADGAPPATPAKVLPYLGVDGTVYRFCTFPEQNPGTTPTDITGSDAAIKAQPVAGFTAPDGTGTATFEIRTAEQSPSQGCSSEVACSLVAVPVMQLQCNPTYDRFGSCAKGSTSAAGQATGNALLGAGYWWSESNWRNRLVVPLEIQPTSDLCPRGDTRPQVVLQGSEVAAGALAQWAPAFCLDTRSAFRLGYTPEGDAQARRKVSTGEIPAALSTRPVVSTGTPVVNAPVAVGGFAISYVIDSTVFQESTAEVTELNLTPRLLAKLLTQSYTRGASGTYGQADGSPLPPRQAADGSTIPAGAHPSIPRNPVSLDQDPDFLAVNPVLVNTPGFRSPLFYPSLVSVDSDVIFELTRYVVADPDARAWLAGAPDPYGMVVNPVFRDVAWPSGQVELRDTTPELRDTTLHSCAQAGVAWLSRAVNPLQSLADAGLSVLDARPTDVTACTNQTDPVPDIQRSRQLQPDGARAVLAVSSTADAARYNLRTAGLQVGTSSADQEPVFVTPTDASMRTALGATTVDPATATLSVDHARLSSTSYPGTMVVNAVVPTAGLDATTAGLHADFLDRAAGPLQTPGTTVGTLPAGFVPLPAAAASLTAAAADLVRAQQGSTVPVTTPPAAEVPAAMGSTDPSGPFVPGAGLTTPTDLGTVPSGSTDGGALAPAAVVDPAAAVAEPAAPAAEASAAPVVAEPVTVAATRGQSSTAGTWALPTLLGAGLVLGILGPLAYVAGQPGNPVRRAGAQLVAAVRRS